MKRISSLYKLVFLKPRNIILTLNELVVTTENLGHAVAQLVEALRYKPEGRGFDSR